MTAGRGLDGRPEAGPDDGPDDGPEGGWQPLDPRVVGVWRAEAALRRLPFAFGAALLGVVAAPVRAPALAAAVVLALAIGAWLALVPPRRHAAAAYRLGAHDIRVRAGAWWRSVDVVPLARVEHVETSASPFERRAGLATLVVHTAGVAHSAVTFPGLRAEEAETLREHLAARAAQRAPS